MASNEYIRGKLGRMVDDALMDALKAVNRVKGEAAKAGGFGGSRMYLISDEEITKVLSELLPRMAVTAFVASGRTTSEATAHELERAGHKFVDDIAAKLQSQYAAAAAFGNKRSVAPLNTQLYQKVREAVDDFRHGMAGEESLAKDPIVSIVTNVTNSSNTVIQNALGENNRQSAEQKALLGSLEQLFNSKEVAELRERDRLAIRDLIKILRLQMEQPEPDRPMFGRWGQRLIEVCMQLGLQAAATAISANLFT